MKYTGLKFPKRCLHSHKVFLKQLQQLRNKIIYFPWRWRLMAGFSTKAQSLLLEVAHQVTKLAAGWSVAEEHLSAHEHSTNINKRVPQILMQTHTQHTKLSLSYISFTSSCKCCTCLRSFSCGSHFCPHDRFWNHRASGLLWFSWTSIENEWRMR